MQKHVEPWEETDDLEGVQTGGKRCEEDTDEGNGQWKKM
jgi:hypothetical protein